eukprot:TRINITY_DN33078_c0_g1_i1.p1 TRINITY_DN33078_c0_g1~~TRINITY_DN33078_c0_g1_i1.p1  ORF type:complete len:323 (+),score=12.71 TRINITY_DN33078_c0_g1_i1:56-970(+)
MECAHNFVIRNTFISILESDGEDDGPFPRQLSDPTPRVKDSLPGFGVGHSQKKHAIDRTTSGSELSRASTRCEELDDFSCVREERSADSITCASVTSFDAFSARVQEQMLEEPASKKGFDIPSEWQGKTSVMIRNISYKCTRDMFCEELDKAGFQDLFDYVYVPVNAGRGTSKGYAFANFVDDRTAYRFKVRFDGRQMDMPGGVKRLVIIPANLQGFSENASHYITKQSELSVASMTHPAKSSQKCAKSIEGNGRRIAADTSTQRGDEAPTSPSENHSVTDSCRQCQRRVFSRARFCQWCGTAM